MRTTLLLASLLLLSPACRRATPAASTRAATSPPAAPLPFGAVCSQDAECQSHACFVGGSSSYCSIRCQQATASTDCPTPLTNGACNKHGFCKKP